MSATILERSDRVMLSTFHCEAEYKMDKQTLRIRLHVYAPVHIGSGEVYDPTQFVIDSRSKKMRVFDPIQFIDSLDVDKRTLFTNLCKGNSLLSLYKFIRDNFDEKKISYREVDMSAGLVKHYEDIMRLGTFDVEKIINQFTLNRTIALAHGNQEPYIPGSSLKGCIKTAYLSREAKEQNIVRCFDNILRSTPPHKVSSDLEKQLLGGTFSKDPFRFVKVSDLLPVRSEDSKNNVKVFYAVNHKKDPGARATREAPGPYQIFECILPGSVFEGTLTIGEEKSALKKSEIVSDVKIEDIFESLNKYFNAKLEDERQVLKKLGVKSPIITLINQNCKGRLTKNMFVVRLGKHSGAEAMTIDNNRRIKIMKGRGRSEFSDAATTLWFAAGSKKDYMLEHLWPFGWGVLEFPDKEIKSA